jgi:ArsR family transcriptional regulator, arsenate/arsenite/antimonite-responsive transcriptional repressor
LPDADRFNRRTATATARIKGKGLTVLLYFYIIRIMEEQTAVVALAALAQSARLRVFRALVGAEPSGMTPGDLSALLDVPASTLSFHLKELVHAGLVTHRPVLSQMQGLMNYLTAHCCQGAACKAPAARRRLLC